MLIQTKHFAEIEVEEKDIYSFPEGLPGFNNEKNFAVIHNPDESSPFKWLQAIGNPSLAFAVINPFEIIADYEINIADEELEALQITENFEVELLSIVVVPESITEISANLAAPIVLNKNKQIAKQISFIESKYSIRHYIFKELQKNGGDY